MKKQVLLSKRFQPEAITELQQHCELVIAEDLNLSVRDALKQHPDVAGLIAFLSDAIDAGLIDCAPNLRIIANYAVGYNNIDVPHAIAKKIYVCHTPDVLTNATADLTMALILAVARRIVEGDAFVRKGLFTGWGANLLLGKELHGATLGIIGLGRIGQATARRARAFGLKVIYYSRTRNTQLESELAIEYRPFYELLPQADIVSLHVSYSPETHHLMSRSAFDAMKKDAIFINVARGGLMDEAYLAEKLSRGELFGAGLDVYEFEPQITARLQQLTNVVLAPHIGSATYQTRLEMAAMTARSMNAALADLCPPYLVPEWRAILA